MKKLLFAALALSCILLPAEAKKKVRVHTIGDSTMADYAENTTGRTQYPLIYQRRPLGQGQSQYPERRLCTHTICPQ